MFKPRFGVRGRILTIALVPSVALLSGGVVVTVDLLHQANRAHQWATVTGTGLAAGLGFTKPITSERLLTAERLAGLPMPADALRTARDQVDTGLRAVQAVTPAFAGIDPNFEAKVLPVELNLIGQLPIIRKRVDAGVIAPIEAYNYYTQFINFLLVADQVLARTVSDAGAAVDMSTSDRLLDASEALARSIALGTAVQTHPGLFRDYVREVGAYHADLDAVSPVLSTDLQNTVLGLTTSPAWQHVSAVEDALVHRTLPVDGDPAGTASVDWLQDAIGNYQQLYSLALAMARKAVDTEKATADRLTRTAVIAGTTVISLGILVLALALVLSTGLIRKLRRLRRETLELADDRLPQIMDGLRSGAVIELDTDIASLDFGSDEIGEIADAFNHAQSAAVAAAIDEARTREGVRAVFLNIAHRSQVVVHRQLEILDVAEHQAEEPSQLDMLFRLDHLATRERRNAENLVILGGEQPGRRWRTPVPLVELVRSAVAETEEYARVDVTRIPELSILGDAVADVIHLLAELVDNATAFSPPESRVEVSGAVVGKGVVVEVSDQGLGMTEAEMQRLNDTMSNPPDFSVAALSSDSRLGLFVVARLAMRTGTSVRFVESDYGGVKVIVRIPSALTVEQLTPGPIMPSDRSDTARHRVRLAGEERAATVNRAAQPVSTVSSSRPVVVRPDQPVDSELPPLPRRGRQTHIAPELVTPSFARSTSDTARPVSAEQARDLWSAIAEGTTMGREVRSETVTLLGSADDEDRSS